MTVAALPAKPPRRSARDVVRALTRPKVGVMLALGFSSGLPFMLVGNTLGLWLKEAGISLTAIGFASWIGLAYAVKFLWGAGVDRLRPPLPGRLGRRRGWMILTQIGVAAGLLGMAASHPERHVSVLVAFGVVAAVFAAAQDTVIDAWRIESAVDADELGLLTAAYSLGFRIALIATEAWILWLATLTGWPLAYALFAALMLIGVAAALFAREPARADSVLEVHTAEAARHPLTSLGDAIVGPFVEFFRAHGAGAALLMLALITFYHLCDYLRGPMSNPYYLALGIGKPTIAAVRTSVGLAGSFIGIALGGWSALRLGSRTTLIIGALLQPLAVAFYAVLGFHGGDFPLVALGSGASLRLPGDHDRGLTGHGLFRRGVGGLHEFAHQPGLHRHPVRPAHLGADLDRQDAEGLLRRHGRCAQRGAEPAGGVRLVLSAGRRHRDSSHPALPDAGALAGVGPRHTTGATLRLERRLSATRS